MITLKPQERTFRRMLLDRARSSMAEDDVLIAYGDLAHQVDPTLPQTFPFYVLPKILGHISRYEHEHGRPMLSALVVSADTRAPGEGFDDLGRQLGFEIMDSEAFWRDQLAAVLDFWRDADPTRATDTILDRLAKELQAMKRRL